MIRIEDLPNTGWLKKAAAISQKIVGSDKYEIELCEYWDYIPKEVLDKVAKHELNESELKYYTKYFGRIKPFIINDMDLRGLKGEENEC